MNGVTQQASVPLTGSLDEVTWDLLRDEWELCAAIGAGPTSIETLVDGGLDEAAALATRVKLLERQGIIRRMGDGFGLVQVVHQRQESVASYVRELLLERISTPDASLAFEAIRWDERGTAGNVERTVARCRDGLLSTIVELASEPRAHDDLSFVFVLAISSDAVPTDVEGAVAVLDVVHSASVQRCTPGLEGHAKIWVADMRVPKRTAKQVCDHVRAHIGALPNVSGQGAVAFGLWSLQGPVTLTEPIGVRRC